MMYTVKVNNYGVDWEAVVTTLTEVAAIAEAVIRSANGGRIPARQDPGGVYYLDWQAEMLEFDDVEMLKAYLFNQRIIVDIHEGL